MQEDAQWRERVVLVQACTYGLDFCDGWDTMSIVEEVGGALGVQIS